MQYNWKYRKYYGNGIVSDNFDDVVNGHSQIRITRDMFYPHTGIRTPIVGVNIVPYHDPPELKEFLNGLIPARSRIYHVWSQLKRAIYEAWMPDKIHVIGASSGYDSRLIAKALKELRHEKGAKWFGETYFVECGGEGKGFRDIMQVLEWEEKNYIIWKPKYDFKYFENICDRFNGLCAYPVNQWYDYYVDRWNEEDIQYISGYGGNISDAMRDNARFLTPTKNDLNIYQRLQLFFKWNYDYQLAAFKQPKYSFHPFWSWRYIKAIAGFEHKMLKTSMYLCKYKVPECSHIRRMTILGDVTDAGHRTVNPKDMKKLYAWFKNTHYGKRSKVKPNPNIEYNRWWLEYCIASYGHKHKIKLR